MALLVMLNEIFFIKCFVINWSVNNVFSTEESEQNNEICPTEMD